MGFRHNNQLPNGHFHKDWARRVKTWFNQPGKKKSRRIARQKKAAAVAPRPLELLRPAVRCPTIRYNTKLRLGRGFTLDELKEAGLTRQYARSVGIAVDHRRKNRSVESMQVNVARLEAYKQKLIVFPRKNKSPKKGDSDPSLLKEATQFKGPLLPISNAVKVEEPRAVTAEEKAFNAYATLRKAQSDARLVGVREKRAKQKAAEEEAKQK